MGYLVIPAYPAIFFAQENVLFNATNILSFIVDVLCYSYLPSGFLYSSKRQHCSTDIVGSKKTS